MKEKDLLDSNSQAFSFSLIDVITW